MRRNWKIWVGALVGALLLYLAVRPFIPPPLPKSIRLGTGPENGRYHAFGKRLAARFEEQGIGVELVPSEGSVQNLERLRNGLDFALVQGGVVPAGAAEGVWGIGSLFYEPIWIFHRHDDKFELVRDLKGKRIAIGEAGSGTAPLALSLLRANGVSGGEVRMGGAAAMEALRAGQVDAVFSVQAPTNEWIHDLVEDGAFALMLFVRADAYAARFAHLEVLDVPRGFVDFELDLPKEDIRLLATTANLLMRDGLHPRLVPLVIELCRDELSHGTMLASPGVFPSADKLDVPVSETALRYYRNGPSWLYRYLPFQVAHALSRLLLMLIPLLTLLYPLLKGAGPLYRFFVFRRIYPWYPVLRELETQLVDAPTPEKRAEALLQIRELETQVAAIRVPARYNAELFALRRNITAVLGHAADAASQASTEG